VIGNAGENAIFRVPLNRHSKRRLGPLDRLNDAISSLGRYDQPFTQMVDGLVMPGVNVKLTSSYDLRQFRVRLDANPVRRRMLARFRILRPLAMHIGRRQMLDQRASADYVEKLQSAANGQYRHIRSQCLVQQANLQLIPGIVHFVAPGVLLPIPLRINVGATAEQQTVQRIERLRVPNRLDASLKQGSLIGANPGLVPERNSHAHGLKN
jgi:hypothetical protein